LGEWLHAAIEFTLFALETKRIVAELEDALAHVDLFHPGVLGRSRKI
jgi:hypothetical protein